MDNSWQDICIWIVFIFAVLYLLKKLFKKNKPKGPNCSNCK